MEPSDKRASTAPSALAEHGPRESTRSRRRGAAAREDVSEAVVLWIDQHSQDIELAELVLARLAPHFRVVGLASHQRPPTRSRHRYDLIVIGDIGFAETERRTEVLRRLFPEVPLLLFSELADKEALEILAQGFDDFLPKSSRAFLELPHFLARGLTRGRERRRAIHREVRVSRLLEHCSIGSFRASLDGTLLEANQSFLRFFGMADLDEANDSDILDQLLPDESDIEAATLRDVREITLQPGDRRVRLTRLLMVDGQGDLIVDGLLEALQETGTAAARLSTTPDGAHRETALDDDDSGPMSVRLRRRLTEEPTQSDDAGATHRTIPRERSSERPASPDDSGSFAASGDEEDFRSDTAPVPVAHLDPPWRRRQSQPISFSEKTQPPTDHRRVDLAAIIRGVVRDLRDPVERTLAIVEVGDMPEIIGHPQQLRILFRNLLENAIRFRSDAPPRISFSGRANGEEVVVSVSDNGIGMTPSTLRSVLAPAESRPGGWSPLGLAISRRIVESHGGRLWAESQLGAGSTFHVSLRSAMPQEAG